MCERSEERASSSKKALAETQSQLERNLELTAQLQQELNDIKDAACSPKDVVTSPKSVLEMISPEGEELLLDLDEQKDKVTLQCYVVINQTCSLTLCHEELSEYTDGRLRSWRMISLR